MRVTESPAGFTAVELRALRTQLTEKLKEEAKLRGVAVSLVRKQYVFTLFLRRLFVDDSGRWMLLGGNALLIRTGGGRFTQDIDLARSTAWDDPHQVLHELQESVEVPMTTDPFRFELSRITPHNQTDAFGYGATTAKIAARAYLGAQVFEPFSIDLTTRRHIDGPVAQVRLRAIIDHATLQNLPAVPTVPVENHLADKICAMYETHTNSPSTRYRDLADIVRIIRHLSFDAGRLDTMLDHETRRRRMTRPTRMVAPASAWQTAYPRAAADFAEFPRTLRPLQASLEVAALSLDEVLSRRRTRGTWDPTQQMWSDNAVTMLTH